MNRNQGEKNDQWDGQDLHNQGPVSEIIHL